MRKRAATLIGASLLILFHLFTVIVPLAASGMRGEGSTFAVVFVGFPLFVFLSSLRNDDPILYGSPATCAAVFCIGGTVMYAVVGALLGWLVDLVRHGLTTRPSERLMAVTSASKATSISP